MRTFPVYSQQPSTINIMLLTIVTMLFITSLESNLIIGSLYLWAYLSISPWPLPLFLWVQFFYFYFFRLYINEIVQYSSFSDLFHLAYFPPAICIVAMNGRNSFFIWLSTSQLSTGVCVLHFLYPFICWWTLRLLQCLAYYK